MRVPQGFLSLPPALLLLLAAQLHAQAGSGNGGDGLQALPTAVRKMSLDEGEKFMPEYYAFAPADLYGGAAQAPLKLLAREADAVVIATPEEEALLAANGSAALAFRPPFPRHYDYRGRDDGGSRVSSSSSSSSSSDEEPQSLYRRTAGALARLQGREFTCPGGTHVCSNIDQPNYCCTDGTTCFVVENAPDAGNVGCCPKGQTCGGSVAACADGNTACPAEDGGGCCISGFVCADVGCVKSTVTVITPTTSMAATTTSQAPPPTSTTTPPTTSQPPSTTTPEPVTSTYNSGSGSGSGTGLPPVRPTSSGPETNPGGATTTAGAGDYCPTGFYACVASAGSGCCRTGRDCSTTSCPPPAASTTIITHGATIVVPLTDALAAASTRPATATCAGGWFLCGADAGPVSGCCPTGYLCGTASCTLSAATATATVQKERPGNAAAGRAAARGQSRVLLACVALCWAMFF